MTVWEIYYASLVAMTLHPGYGREGTIKPTLEDCAKIADKMLCQLPGQPPSQPDRHTLPENNNSDPQIDRSDSKERWRKRPINTRWPT